MLEHALKYSSLGWKIFPIVEGCKAPPATPNGYKDATNEPSKVSEWFGNGRNYNVAISTGRDSGFFSLDVDCKKGKDGFLWLNAQGDLPNTVIQRTPSGGKQFFFKMPDFPVYCSSDKIAEGVDIRGDGGYVLAPPSFCKKTPVYEYEGPYEYMSEQGAGEIEIVNAPQWLLDILFDLLAVEEPIKENSYNHEELITMKEIVKEYGINLKEVKSGIFQGSHPLHSSSNGANFKIDTNRNIWSCYRHTKADGRPVGGGTMQLIAMMEGIIDCEHCTKGALRGDNYKKVINILKKKFNVSSENLKLDPVNPMYQIAVDIRDGGLDTDYIYCIEDDQYYFYDENYWKNMLETELALKMNRKIPGINKNSLSQKSQIFGHLRVELQKRVSCFNVKKRLNFPEGEYDFKLNELVPHHKENYSTTRLPYSYNKDTKCPLWIKTLNEILENNQDKINTLQEFFGYCLITEMQLKKALLLLGESDTGKSTVLFIFKEIIGEINYSNVSLKNMGHPQYTPMMINKLVNIDTDVDKNASDYEANFKKITAYEEIECNQKYLAAFRFRPECRIILSANIFPRITDYSSAFYNRLIIVPFDRIFSQEEQDPELVSKLRFELPGIFNWCVEGYNRLKARGKFQLFDFSKEAVEELEDTNNPSNLFFKEHIEIEMNSYVEKGDLYDKYKQWSETNKQYTLTAATFSVAVYKQFHKQTPKKAHLPDGKRIWRNIKYVHFKTNKIDDKGWSE